jgi:hypothetical protein
MTTNREYTIRLALVRINPGITHNSILLIFHLFLSTRAGSIFNLAKVDSSGMTCSPRHQEYGYCATHQDLMT